MERQLKSTIKYPHIKTLITVLVCFLAVAITYTVIVNKPHKTMVILGGTAVSVDVADTEASREQGLSGREKLGLNEGMFFIFEKPGQYGFWMKDMNFPIDIIWFDANYRIVFVKEQAEPSSYPDAFIPNASAQYVLEAPAGFFSYHHLKIGDVLEIRK